MLSRVCTIAAAAMLVFAPAAAAVTMSVSEHAATREPDVASGGVRLADDPVALASTAPSFGCGASAALSDCNPSSKPPIEPPVGGNECVGGGLFGTGVSCRTNPNRIGAAVPEPGTLALLGVGLLGLAASLARRRR